MKLQLGASLLSPSIREYLQFKVISIIVAEVTGEVKSGTVNCEKWTKSVFADGFSERKTGDIAMLSPCDCDKFCRNFVAYCMEKRKKGGL